MELTELRMQPDRSEVRTSEGYSVAAIFITLADRLHILMNKVARVSCISYLACKRDVPNIHSKSIRFICTTDNSTIDILGWR